MEKHLDSLREGTTRELKDNILPYWMSLIDKEYGGFLGRVDGHNTLHPNAPKGAVMMCRILWTFSAAYRTFREAIYLDAARAAKDFIVLHMLDPEYGGIYWSVARDGSPIETKKQVYAQGFAIYGLCEFYRATDERDSLDEAMKLFGLLEKHAFDPQYGGYFEAFTREWEEISDMRLSERDANERKSMNTNLHILEPYTNLFRVNPVSEVGRQLESLIRIFMNRIIDPETGHCGLFFDDEWDRRDTGISYGHDIEAFWLLYEAMENLGNHRLWKEFVDRLPAIADAAFEGLRPDGSMIYEYDPLTGRTDNDRHWWVQAEAVVGAFYLYRVYERNDALDHVLNGWDYIQAHLLDKGTGEWYWSVRADGVVNQDEDKAGFWKCPYHNGRMCILLGNAIK